jgi:hypothetical protein
MREWKKAFDATPIERKVVTLNKGLLSRYTKEAQKLGLEIDVKFISARWEGKDVGNECWIIRNTNGREVFRYWPTGWACWPSEPVPFRSGFGQMLDFYIRRTI